jgi:non-specific serine/threonine protein kinase
MPKVIVFGLYEHPDLKISLPSAVVAEKDKEGKLGQKIKKATPDVVSSFHSLSLSEPETKCLGIIEDLSDDSLTSRFVKSKRSSLKKQWKDATIKKSIISAIDKQMNEFFQLCSAHNLLFCTHFDTKTSLEHFLLRYDTIDFKPNLHFKKINEGIEYKLLLTIGDETYSPKEHNCQIVCNNPGWIVWGKTLTKLELLNGNKLKPFLTKSSIKIPSRMTKDYMDKFVKEMIHKTDVTLDGFDYNVNDAMPKTELKAREDFISESWLFDLLVHYGNETFHYWAKESQRTRLDVSGDDVSFGVTKRDSNFESSIIEQLNAKGLELDKTKRLQLSSPSEDPFAVLYWMIEHKKELEKLGINVSLPEINKHSLSIHKPTIELSTVEENDWFDVKAVITIGTETVRFADLISNIKAGNRLFEMENGETFIIPEEWMTKYSSLSRWAKVSDDKVSILKSQYTILEEEKKDNNSTRLYDQVKELQTFEPSSKLKASLRPYQVEGAGWLVNHKEHGLGCCLADDMGLGKTLQTIAALLHEKEQPVKAEAELSITNQTQLNLFATELEDTIQPLRTLIVMPASLIFNWEFELRKFAPQLFVYKHIGPQRKKKILEIKVHDVILSSYQTVLRDIELLKKIEWRYIVLDESQYIKNPASKIFQAIQELHTDYKISLSGTPIENSLSDLWAQMQFINPDILGTFKFFKKHFQTPIQKDNDESLIDELKKLTGPYILRRTKTEVLKDLPGKTEQYVFCEMSAKQKTTYETEKNATRNLILDSNLNDPQTKMQVLSSLLKLRQIANHPTLCDEEYKGESGKFDNIKESLLKLHKSGQKALLFSSFTSHLDLFADWLKEASIPFVTLTGKSTQKQRQKAVKQFQESEDIPFFLISIKAGGTGLNLTAAHYVFILDPWWNPFIEEQAIARAHRIGLNHSLHVQKYISKDTIEEKIMTLQQKKKALAEEIISTSEALVWNKQELDFLLS